MTHKLCLSCHHFLPLSMFKPYSPKTPHRLRNHCVTCIRVRQRSPSYRHRRALTSRLRRYGITEADYAALLLSQKNACAICRQPCAKHDFLSVDHDHTTGEVRGLLCALCNTALGQFQDSPTLLRRAAAYVSAYTKKTKKGAKVAPGQADLGP